MKEKKFIMAAVMLAAATVFSSTVEKNSVVINELSLLPENGGNTWIELKNRTESAVYVGGWTVTNNKDFVYTIPSSVAPMPPSSYLVIQLDGNLSGNSFSFDSNGKAVVHAQRVLLNKSSVSEIALTNNTGVVSYVAWDRPSISQLAKSAVEQGVVKKYFDAVRIDRKCIGVLNPITSGGSIGLIDNTGEPTAEKWAVYKKDETTPGAENGVPAPGLNLPANGTVIGGFVGQKKVGFSWERFEGARYHFQLCTDNNCTQTIKDTIVSDNYFDLDDPQLTGNYYWRVQAQAAGGKTGGWSSIAALTIKSQGIRAGVITHETTLGVIPLAARKDTRMLDLDGSLLVDPLHQWDLSHASAPHYCDEASWRCWAVGATMMNRFYGGNIMRDEVKFHVKSKQSPTPDPEGDFPHGSAGGAYESECADAVTFALGITDAQLNRMSTKPTETEFKAFIDGGRPLYWWQGSHITVLDGYRYNDDDFEVRVNNTDNEGSVAWENYAARTMVVAYCPNSGITTARTTDPRINMDSDADGICDFDEQVRFLTSSTNEDSENDGVSDKKEVISYTFRTPKVAADFDADGLRAELDFDSDNGGRSDGVEDADHDGVFDAGETDVYNTSDDFASVALLKVEMLDATLGSNQTQPGLKITNLSTTTSISGFKVKLWFSKEEYPSQTIVVDKYNSSPSDINLSTAPMPAHPNVIAVQIAYPSTFTLAPGASTVVSSLSFSVHFQNWYPGVWMKSNDWSSIGIGSTLTETSNVTVYSNANVLIYGNEPVFTCPPGPPELKVEIKDGAPGDATQSCPRLRISNLSSCRTLDAGFSVRFWVSKAEYPSQTVVADKWYSSPSTITLTVGNHPTNPNIRYVQVNYPAGYSLDPGQVTNPDDLQFGVHFQNYWPGTWVKTNDWSWQGVGTSFTQTMNVTVYDNEMTLIYGTVP